MLKYEWLGTWERDYTIQDVYYKIMSLVYLLPINIIKQKLFFKKMFFEWVK